MILVSSKLLAQVLVVADHQSHGYHQDQDEGEAWSFDWVTKLKYRARYRSNMAMKDSNNPRVVVMDGMKFLDIQSSRFNGAEHRRVIASNRRYESQRDYYKCLLSVLMWELVSTIASEQRFKRRSDVRTYQLRPFHLPFLERIIFARVPRTLKSTGTRLGELSWLHCYLGKFRRAKNRHRLKQFLSSTAISWPFNKLDQGCLQAKLR